MFNHFLSRIEDYEEVHLSKNARKEIARIVAMDRGRNDSARERSIAPFLERLDVALSRYVSFKRNPSKISLPSVRKELGDLLKATKSLMDAIENLETATSSEVNRRLWLLEKEREAHQSKRPLADVWKRLDLLREAIPHTLSTAAERLPANKSRSTDFERVWLAQDVASAMLEKLGENPSSNHEGNFERVLQVVIREANASLGTSRGSGEDNIHKLAVDALRLMATRRRLKEG